jgi:hypothetical protein
MFYGGLYLVQKTGVNTARTLYISSFHYQNLPCVQNRGERAQRRQSAKLFLQSSDLGLPQPLTRRRLSPPPPLWFRGKGHTSWRERGWESPNSDEGTFSVVLCKYTYFVGEGVAAYTVIGPHISSSRKGKPIVGIYNSLTDT